MSIQHVMIAGLALLSGAAAVAQKEPVLFQKGPMTITRSGTPQAQSITVHRGNTICPKGTHWVVIIMDDRSGSFRCM